MQSQPTGYDVALGYPRTGTTLHRTTRHVVAGGESPQSVHLGNCLSLNPFRGCDEFRAAATSFDDRPFIDPTYTNITDAIRPTHARRHYRKRLLPRETTPVRAMGVPWAQWASRALCRVISK